MLEAGPGARVKGEAYAGYMNQDYTGATFQTISTFTYGGALAWVIAPRWTAVVELRNGAIRLFQETAGLDEILRTLHGSASPA